MTMPKNLTPIEQEAWKVIKRERAKEWQNQNKERAQKRKRAWYLKNRELIIQRAVEYKRKKNPPKVRIELSPEEKEIKRKEYMKKYYSENKETIVNRWVNAKKEYMKNPIYRLKEAIRSRIKSALVKGKFPKKSDTFTILGCSFDDFVSHIENQFADGMTWENQGAWHLDHKVPLFVATNEDEIIKLNHYSNFQPLFAQDNFSKNRKMLPKFISLRKHLIGR